MKNKKKFDFSGYATKVDLKCADGRVIRKDAFKHNDGETVPLVWQHMHNDPNNVLGHALLENREDGVYAYCLFNDSEAGKQAKLLVQHGDINALSIHANQLQQKGSNVLHGQIREVSLVLAGANPGARIDNVEIRHTDGTYDTDDSEAIIYTGEDLSLEDVEFEHADSEDGKTMKDVFDTLNEEQKNVVYAMIAHALGGNEEEIEQSADEDDEDTINHSNKGGKGTMKKNVFDSKDDGKEKKNVLTHSQIQAIFADAKKCGSLKEAFLEHAGTYGIDNIDILFPDAQTITNSPDFIKRETEWVAGVLSGTRHTPFSRIKSVTADITADEARAKGYITGNEKTEEVFGLLKRETTPTTIYKKQKLDRDDIIDITDLDVVAWLKAEMRVMLDEELARAVLIGDGRDVLSPDKINESKIRPIYKDDDLYAHKVLIDADADTLDIMDEIVRARVNYKGSGNPVLYTTNTILTNMLLIRDTTGHRLFKTKAEVESALMVSKIVEVEVMENQSRVDGADTIDLIGLLVNLKDYSLGADKGGQVSMFDDFDIDYNQYKYLLETRCSGALTKPKSALVIEKVRAAEPVG